MTLLSPIATLQDDTAAPAGGGGMDFIFPLLAVLAIFYFVLILPERKKQKQREAMIGGMKKGDEIMTSSGIYGRIAQVQDDVVTVQVADGVRLRFNKAAIQNVLSKDSDAVDPPTV